MRDINLFVRSTVFNFFLAIWTIVITTIFIPTLFTFNRKIISRIGRIWSAVVLSALQYICHINYKVQGAGNLPKEPFLVACKHQSMWETIYLMWLLNKPVFIIKKQLTLIPFYGWYLSWMGMIAIDRKQGISALKLIIKKVHDSLKNNRSIVIFPEGTRCAVGEKPDLQSGIVAIYQSQKDVPIVPMAMDSGKFWKTNQWLRYPGTVTVQIGEPITSRTMSKTEFLALLKQQINVLD